ncbi:MAG: hypothetical protein J3Q66DRAFT_431540 [Benniella sp.]|nr:MAG: hypothetical protein J3Q66DRAFT_431540 [Benniella sp.]
MGIPGISKILKATGGTLALDLKSKFAHVDLLSLFFPLIQTGCFRVTSKAIAKEATPSSSSLPQPTLSAPAATQLMSGQSDPSPHAMAFPAMSDSTSPTQPASEPPEQTLPVMALLTPEPLDQSLPVMDSPEPDPPTSPLPAMAQAAQSITRRKRVRDLAPSVPLEATRRSKRIRQSMAPVAYPAKPVPTTKTRGKRAQQHEESSSSKRPKLMSSVVNDINQSFRHPALFIGADGHITPHAPDHTSQPCCSLSLKTFRHVAKRIDQIMKESIDKNKAIIHCDGPTPSRQKSGERLRRQEYLAKKLQELSLQVDKISINKRSLTAVYNKCKSLYRAPETAISEILDELSNLDWKVCRCQYQADSHIAELCRDDPDAVIVTKDSDFIVYENTESVIMPVGRGHELTRFDKADVMTALKLPSARHLLLASILSKNDYSSPVPWFGIHRNAEVVRELEIDQYSSNFQLVGIMKEAIRKYLVQIGKIDSKTPHDYRHAITAFVECREDTSDDAVPSRSTHDSIVELLRKIEQAKIARRRPASSVSDPATLSNIASLSGPSSSLEPASLLDLASPSDQASLSDPASSLDLTIGPSLAH